MPSSWLQLSRPIPRRSTRRCAGSSNCWRPVPGSPRPPGVSGPGSADRLEAWQSLIACLADEGVPRTHANISALSARVFRPGSGADSDDLLRLALERWDAIDARAGFAIDHRAVCAFLAEDDQVVDMLTRIVSPAEGRDPRARAQLVLLSLLWTRAYARRPETLRAANRFVVQFGSHGADPFARRAARRPAAVDVDDEDWRDDLAVALQAGVSAQLVSWSGQTTALARAIRELMVDPFEVDWLQVHPQLDGITRDGGQYSVSTVAP